LFTHDYCFIFSFFFFFFSSRRRHTRFSRDWSSDVCSSDLFAVQQDCRQMIHRLSSFRARVILVSSPATSKKRLWISNGPVQSPEIGRASCRERVEVSVVDVVV